MCSWAEIQLCIVREDWCYFCLMCCWAEISCLVREGWCYFCLMCSWAEISCVLCVKVDTIFIWCVLGLKCSCVLCVRIDAILLCSWASADPLRPAQSSLLRRNTGKSQTPFSPFHIWLSAGNCLIWGSEMWGRQLSELSWWVKALGSGTRSSDYSMRSRLNLVGQPLGRLCCPDPSWG